MTSHDGGNWTVEDLPDLHGRTFLVTGASSGLGLASSRLLANRGARVVMAVRDLRKGEQARRQLRADQPTAEVELRRLDLADLDSVRACARGMIADQLPVDVLINNGGIMMAPAALTRHGVERHFGTNHLGHFALTGLLLGTLRDGYRARVVTVSSELSRLSPTDFSRVTEAGYYRPDQAYALSKLANLLFGLELDRRLRAAAVPVRSLVAHPGYTNTNLFRAGPTGWRRRLLTAANQLVGQGVTGGALSQLYAATAPTARGGEYIGPDKVIRGHPTVVIPAAPARDPKLARRLWQRSEELTGVRFDLPRR